MTTQERPGFFVWYFLCLEVHLIKSRKLAFGSFSENLYKYGDITSTLQVDGLSVINASNEFGGGSVNHLPADREWLKIGWMNLFGGMPDRSEVTEISLQRATEIGAWIKNNMYSFYAFLTRGFSGLDAKIVMPMELVKCHGFDFLATCQISQDEPGSYDIIFDGRQEIKYPEVSLSVWSGYYSKLTTTERIKSFLEGITRDTNMGDQIKWQNVNLSNTPIFCEVVDDRLHVMSYEEALSKAGSFSNDAQYLDLLNGFHLVTDPDTSELTGAVYAHASGFLWWNNFSFYIASDIWPLSNIVDNSKLPKFLEPEIGLIRPFWTISNLSSNFNRNSFYYISARYAAAHLLGEKVARVLVGLDDEWIAYQESLPEAERLTMSVSTFRNIFLGGGAAYSNWYDKLPSCTMFGQKSGYIFPDIVLDMDNPSSFVAPSHLMGGGIAGMGPAFPTGVGVASELIFQRLGFYEAPSETEYLSKLYQFEQTLQEFLALIAKFYLFAIGQHENFIIRHNGTRYVFHEEDKSGGAFNSSEHIEVDSKIYFKASSNGAVFSDNVWWSDIHIRESLENVSGYYPNVMAYTSENKGLSLINLFWHNHVCAAYVGGGAPDGFYIQPQVYGMDASSKLMRLQSQLSETVTDVQTRMKNVDLVLKDMGVRLDNVEVSVSNLIDMTEEIPQKQQVIIDELTYSTPILEAAITELLRLVELAEGTSGLATIADYVQSVKASVLSHYELSTEEVRRLSRVLTFLGDNIEGDLTSIPVMVSSEVERLQILIKRMESTIADRLDQLPTKADNQKATATNFLSSAILGLR